MFLIRQSKPEDVGTLLKLARMVYFINLPPDERLIAAKIQHSRNCFMRLAAGQDGPGGKAQGRVSGFASTVEDSDLFMFTIEGLDTQVVVGTAQVRAHVGGPGNPNYSS